MKKLLLIPFMVMFLFGCESKQNATANQNTAANQKADVMQFEKNMQKIVAKQDPDVKVTASVIKNISDKMPGFTYVELKFFKGDQQVGSDKVFTNGSVFFKDATDSTNLLSFADEIEFDTAVPVSLDMGKLTFVKGNKDSKNIIVEVTDFQCPFCIEANSYLNKALEDKSDYALYVLHLPLEMHPNAKTMAQVYEAGVIMGYNFKDELFASNYIKQLENKIAGKNEEISRLQNSTDANSQKNLEKLIDNIVSSINDDIINDFAAKTSDAAKFKNLVKSPEVVEKVENAVNYASSLGINATPAFFFNGKLISGYKEGLIAKSLDLIK